MNTLGLLCDGSLRGLFDRPSTITADPTTPALSLDLSALDNDADDVVAAAMLCSWAWSATLADTAGDRRNTVQVQDELWRALRAAPGLVEHSDRITRLGRHRGIVSIQVTHSLDDLDALPTATDRAKARGMAARNAILILGGMAPQDIDRLAGIVALTDPERELVASWAAPPTWHPGHTHPGRGRYLIKSGQRIGLPGRDAAHPDRGPALRHRHRLPDPAMIPSNSGGSGTVGLARDAAAPLLLLAGIAAVVLASSAVWVAAGIAALLGTGSWTAPSWSLALLPRLFTGGVPALVGPAGSIGGFCAALATLVATAVGAARFGLATDSGHAQSGHPVLAARASARRPDRACRPDQGGRAAAQPHHHQHHRWQQRGG